MKERPTYTGPLLAGPWEGGWVLLFWIVRCSSTTNTVYREFPSRWMDIDGYVVMGEREKGEDAVIVTSHGIYRPRLLLPTYFFQQPLTVVLSSRWVFGRWFFLFFLLPACLASPGGPGRAGKTTSNKAGILGGPRSSPPFESPPIESRPRYPGYTHKQVRALLCSQRSLYATSKGDEVSAPLGRRPAPVLLDPDCSSAKGSAEEVNYSLPLSLFVGQFVSRSRLGSLLFSPLPFPALVVILVHSPVVKQTR